MSLGIYLVCGIVAGLCYIVYRGWPRPIAGIPYYEPSAKTFFGDARTISKYVTENKTVVAWILERGRQLDSPIFQVLVPFNNPLVVVTDYRESQDVMARRTREFDRSGIFESTFAGTVPDHHIHMQTNDRWRAQRKLLADTMSSSFLQSVGAGHLHNHALQLMDLWRVKARLGPGHAFTVAEDINQMALDAIWATAFGSDINTVKTQTDYLQKDNVDLPPPSDESIVFDKPDLPADYDAIIYITDAITTAVQSSFPVQAHWLARQKNAYKQAKSHTNKLVANALADAKRRFLTNEATDEMIKCATDNMVRREQQAAVKEGREPGFNSPAAKDELLGFLLAGHDTTSTTIMWGVKFLTDHPEVQDKARRIIRETYPEEAASGTIPSADAIYKTSIPYLDAVIEEILRQSGTVPMSSRKTTIDVQLLGHRIPKGVDVFFMSHCSGYTEPDLFSDRIDDLVRSQSSRETKSRVGTWDPDDVRLFKPERWMKVDENGQEAFDPHAGPAHPFGAGIRGCFGKRLAYLELRTLFTLMLWSFKLERVPESLSSYKGIDTLTWKPVQCYIRPVPISGEDIGVKA